MSKINAVRMINLNYNNNAIRISDEIFHLNGDSTLLSLQNGGGKSVLVQMMLAPFVHKRFQNTKDRTFASYFTTNKPTFILVEWKLDGEAGYVLTGMMVRKNQELAEENANELEMINFVSEYKKRCPQDIYHLAVVEKNKKEVILKSFSACRQLFETYKREREVPFFYYDMNNSAQMKQYFDKIKEYQINYKEWETIIKKVNMKESGLSDLFSDCKDEKGLVEKWFLEAVENKLNKEKNRMQEFQSIVEKYVIQYKDNQSKIKRRDAIKSFEAEAEQIQTEALRYQELSQKKQYQEEKIADFIAKLREFLQLEQEKDQSVQQEIRQLFEDISHLEYEKISGEIYEIEQRISDSMINWNMIQLEKDDIERAEAEIEEKLHLLICAKQQEQVDEAKSDYSVESQKLMLCKEEGQDLEPERKRLGGQLKQYYRVQSQEKEIRSNRCEQNIVRMKEEHSKEKENAGRLAEEEKRIVGELGGIQSKLLAYDEKEEQFNQQYQTAFRRNIIGEYEAGLFSVTRQEYEKILEQSEREKITAKRGIDEGKEKQRSLQRNLQDIENNKVKTEGELSTAEGKLGEYENELRERRVILHYFNLKEDSLFRTEEILNQAARKLKEIEIARRTLETEENELQKEYKKLTQGQILELPEDFKRMLEEAGISYVYGMEWLLKNQKSAEENQRLVQNHPFLPYALIMTRQKMNRLTEQKESVYTSFPIPVLVRESLEAAEDKSEQTVLNFKEVSFYLWFNKNLLDEEKLAAMVAEKEQELQKVQQGIQRKSMEYSEYIEKQERIKNQKVSKEAYGNVKENIEQLKQQIRSLETELSKKRQEMSELESAMNGLEQSVTRLENSIHAQKQRLEEFLRLESAYQKYEENKKLLEKKKKEQDRLVNQQKLVLGKLEKLQEQLLSEEHARDRLEEELRACREKLIRYRQYEEQKGEEALAAEKATEAENRYVVITSEVSAKQQELEQRTERAAKRMQVEQEELLHLQKKYQLTGEQWKNVRYDRKEESHLESEAEDRQRKIKGKERLLLEERVRIEKYKTEEELKRKELKKQCDTEVLLAKEEIQTIDFDTAMKDKNYKRKECEKRAEFIQKKMNGYGEILTALAEYNELQCKSDVVWESELSEMSAKELTNVKGILIRDYNAYYESIRTKRGDLDRLLGRISRMEQFQEEFYQKPLDALSELTADAALVLKQLETILQSFRNLMEKLLVDISFVEKEKAKVVELIEDYLKEVHENLGKIDHNSTITIREKAVKMLKIGLPDWEENEALYQLRLQDYIDDVTEKGIAILEENHNVTEYLGTRITTRMLYDAVIGIANVQIRMFKIEAQREYPISWSDVAKNSGGEGFLSAFVILSSLLYYMRKDDSDIFADRNEGKVLVMDNPFAQTNAAHLLKPLMEMAKKTNTQLICLSGLGGDSIYSCFDNIYVLTLIAANLRNGMQYLKADHMRGSEEETMIVSQIEVMEQQELVF